MWLFFHLYVINDFTFPPKLSFNTFLQSYSRVESAGAAGRMALAVTTAWGMTPPATEERVLPSALAN